MNILIGILVALIIIGTILWGIYKVLGVIKLPEPFNTFAWVIVVIVAVFTFVQMSGLYDFKFDLHH